MKKRWIVLICATSLAVIVFVFLTAWDYFAVSYTKEKVSLNSIKPNETVLVMEQLDFARGHQYYVLVINKNRQAKFVDLSSNREQKEFLPSDYDAILQDKNIPFLEEKVELSDWTLRKIINIDNYKLKTKPPEGYDMPYFTYYSVCGSGKNRKMVVMKEDGASISNTKNIRANKLCGKMYELEKKALDLE